MNPIFRIIALIGSIFASLVLLAGIAITGINTPASLVGIGYGLAYIAVLLIILRLTPFFPRGRGTWKAIIACILWGGGVAVALVMPAAEAINEDTLRVGWTDALASWAGAYPEELTKAACASFLLIAFPQFNRPWHGLVAGGLVGLGFETAENYLYAANFAAYDPYSDMHGVNGMWLARTVIGPYMHVTWAALSTFAIASAFYVADKSKKWRIGVAALGLFTSFCLHFTWNYSDSGRTLTEINGLPITVTFVRYAIVCIIMYGLLITVAARTWRTAKKDRSYQMIYQPRVLV